MLTAELYPKSNLELLALRPQAIAEGGNCTMNFPVRFMTHLQAASHV